jgi:hypothetical protein
MPGLVPGIHVFAGREDVEAGTSPAMTVKKQENWQNVG